MPLAQRILRPSLLDGVAVAVAGRGPDPLRDAAAATCAELGAMVAALHTDPGDEAALTAEVAALHPVGVLVADAAGPFAAAGGGLEGLRAGVDGAWNATRAVVNAHLRAAGGLVVLLAPRPGAGPHAGAARSALENLARTCSVEWARFGVRPVAVLPGDQVDDREAAALVAWLASPAGAYFSGCAFTLR